MAKLLADYLARVKITVADDAARFTDAQKEDMIREAVSAYSRARPRKLDHDLVGDGKTSDFPAPPDWQVGFSEVLFLQENPDEVPPQYLDLDRHHRVAQRGEVERIQLLQIVPGAGKVIRMKYTAEHVVSTTANTIPAHNFSAVCNLAASRLAMALATKYAESVNSTIGADAVSQIEKARLFEALSRRLESDYRAVVPDMDDSLRFKSLDSKAALDDQRHLFHRRPRSF